MGDFALVANIGHACRDRDVGRRQVIAAEDQRARGDLVADALRANLQRIGFDVAAAAQTEGKHIRHTEVGTDAADAHGNRRFTREALRQHANVGGRAANIDHNGIFQSRKKGRAAHTVGRARGEGQHRVFFDKFGTHQRAVVLADEEGRGDTESRQRVAEGLDDLDRQLGEAGIHGGGVLAFEQADPPDFVREADTRAGDFFGDDFGGALFLIRIDRRKDRRDRHTVDACVGDFFGGVADFRFTER